MAAVSASRSNGSKSEGLGRQLTNEPHPQMTVKIQRADEVADFASCLADIDDIFFTSSARRAFGSQEEKQAFREMSLGRYIDQHRGSFFVALNDAGGAVGYLAGCLENPLTLIHFNAVGYFRDIDDLCRDYPAHLHVTLGFQFAWAASYNF